jgi:hypothetical protein
MKQPTMKELEEGEEYCPVCKKINNPGAVKFNCSHFIALQFEGELHWSHPLIDELFGEISEIQEFLDSKTDLSFLEGDELFEAIDPYFNTSIDALENLLASIPISYGNSEIVGSTWYLEDKTLLSNMLQKLNDFKLKIINTIPNS